MARIARVVLPGHPHHVTQRGVRSMRVFFDDEDRQEYVRLLGEQGERAGVEFLSWCLMPNHVHLVVVPGREESLARGIGEAHRLYTRMVNFREGVRGHLFQERFYSCPLDEPHFVAAVRYVERNPVRARIVARAWDYDWSSARFHLDGRRRDPLVTEREPFGMELDWRELLEYDPRHDETERIRKTTRTGRPLGELIFVRLAEKLTGRQFVYRKRGWRKGRRRG